MCVSVYGGGEGAVCCLFVFVSGSLCVCGAGVGGVFVCVSVCACKCVWGSVYTAWCTVTNANALGIWQLHFGIKTLNK